MSSHVYLNLCVCVRADICVRTDFLKRTRVRNEKVNALHKCKCCVRVTVNVGYVGAQRGADSAASVE